MHWYILNLLYCLLPAVAMFFGAQFIDNPWILLIAIHVVIMLIIPYVLMKTMACLSHARDGTGWYSSYGNDDLYGIMVGCLWAVITVGIYWLCCTVRNLLNHFSNSDLTSRES